MNKRLKAGMYIATLALSSFTAILPSQSFAQDSSNLMTEIRMYYSLEDLKSIFLKNNLLITDKYENGFAVQHPEDPQDWVVVKLVNGAITMQELLTENRLTDNKIEDWNNMNLYPSTTFISNASDKNYSTIMIKIDIESGISEKQIYDSYIRLKTERIMFLTFLNK